MRAGTCETEVVGELVWRRRVAVRTQRCWTRRQKRRREIPWSLEQGPARQTLEAVDNVTSLLLSWVERK